MSSTDKANITLKGTEIVSKYMHKSMIEFKNWERELRNLTDQMDGGFTDLLFNNTLPEREINRIKRRTIRDYLNDFGFQVTSKDVPDEMRKEAEDDALLAVKDEMIKRQAKLFGIIDTFNGDKTIGNALRREKAAFYNNGYLALEYIRNIWYSSDPASKATRDAALAKDRDTACAPAALTELDCDAFRKFFTDLETANDRLEGTDHHYKDATLIEKTIEAIAYNDHALATNIRMVYKTELANGDLPHIKTLIEGLLTAHSAGRRAQGEREATQALRAQVEEMAALRAELAALRADTRRGNNQYQSRPRTSTPCDHCGGAHRPPCVGMLIATGKSTREQASKDLPSNFGDDIKKRICDSAVERYRNYQGTNKKDDKKDDPPLRAARAATINCLFVDARESSAMAAITDVMLEAGDIARCKIDSGCDRHMFNDMAWFPDGIDKPRTEMKVRVADGLTLNVIGIGTARAKADAGFGGNDPVMMQWSGALLVEGLAEALISVRQAWEQRGTDIQFADKCCYVFPDGNTVQFGKDYYQDCIICAPEYKASSVITRGKTTKRTTADIWHARLPVSASTMQKLPNMCLDAPILLYDVTRDNTADDPAIRANAQLLRRPPSTRTRAQAFGEMTSFDIWSPGGKLQTIANNARMCITFLDEATGFLTPHLMEFKSQSPAMFERYLVENDGRHNNKFVGGVAWTDNERVLNSSAIKASCIKHGLTLKNSCEYEPWQNGAVERGHRTLASIAREFHDRGGANTDDGYKFWGYSILQAANVYNSTADHNGKTPYELKNGKKPSLNMFRPMFCKAIVTKPKHMLENDLDTRGETAIHLGIARYKPGWLCYILDGPRRGKTITTTQVTFIEDEFPLLNRDDGDTDTDDTFWEAVIITNSVDDNDPAWSAEPTAELDDVSMHDNEAPSVGGEDDDAPASTGVRRSSRLRGVTLPQTVFSMWAQLDDVKDVVQAYATNIDGQIMPMPDISPYSYDDIANIKDPEARKRWYEAYDKEFLGLIASKTLVPVQRPRDVRVVPLKEMSKIKSNGTFKWRGCIRGDRLIKGVDYDRTFSPTVRWQTVRTVLATAASKKMCVASADVTQAYGCANNPHDWYTYMPKGLRGRPEYIDTDGNEMVCKVGNLYGGPPAGRHWYFEADATLRAYGLEQSTADPCLYTCRVGGGWLYICLYVDDLLIVSSTDEDRNDFLTFWQDKFPCSTSDGLEFEYLGANISVSARGIKLSSERYINTLVGTYFPGGIHGKYSVPADKSIVEAVELATDKKVVPDQSILKRFQSLVGALLYVSVATRPDIQFAVSMLSRCMAWPNDDLLTMAERVLQYLHHTSALGLFYSAEVATDPYLSGMSDANFSSRRSTSGYILSIANAAVSFVSKKQVSTALSTCEAEIHAASLAALEIVFIRGLLIDLGYEPKNATSLRVDNSSTIDVAKDPMLHKVTKHIQRRELKIRELVADKTIDVSFVASRDNVADIFTKPLDRKNFERLRNIMMNSSM